MEKKDPRPVMVQASWVLESIRLTDDPSLVPFRYLVICQYDRGNKYAVWHTGSADGVHWEAVNGFYTDSWEAALLNVAKRLPDGIGA